MIDKIKKAEEELRAAKLAQTTLNDTVEARDGNMTEEEQTQFDGLTETRSGITSRLARLKAMEADKIASLDDDTQVRNFDKPDEDKEKEEKLKVKRELAEGDEARDFNTEALLCGAVSNNQEAVRAATEALVAGGHYGRGIEIRDGFSQFKDSKGGIFIPTTISDTTFEMTQEYGVIPKRAINFGINGENKKIPSIIGRPVFAAVNEKSAIPGSSSQFGGIQLSLKKWGAIVDWTNEIGASAGSKILPILMRKIAEASAFLYDDTAFNGDGTSLFNNLKGFIHLAADSAINYVRKTVAGAGNTTFAALDAADYLSVQYDVSPSVRSRGIYVMHPDMLEHLLNLKDDQGQFVYKGPNSNATVPTLWGRPLDFSEAFPITDGSDAPAVLYFDPQYFAYGTGKRMSVKNLSEAVIVDEDSVSINLATQDAQALRFTQHFDFQPSNLTTTTNSVAKGAFAVLYTA